MQHRNARFDNLRFLLVFLVVFGHLVELFWQEDTAYAAVYRVIYSFHVPALLFISGWFARFDLKKLLLRLLLPFLVFQLLYRLFDLWILKNGGGAFLTPYWHLWYLFVLLIYCLMLPLLPKRTPRNAVLVIGGSVVLSLLTGFVTPIGYLLSASRLLVFFPFFAAGYYCRALTSLQQAICRKKSLYGVLSWIGAIGGSICVLLWRLPRALLYGSLAYIECGGSVWQRVLLLATGFCWISALLLCTPARRIPLLSAIGRNTMPAYLLHGFVVRLLPLRWLDRGSAVWNLPELLLIGVLCMFAFGNPVIQRLFTFLRSKQPAKPEK